jgi:hypothetical protein
MFPAGSCPAPLQDFCVALDRWIDAHATPHSASAVSTAAPPDGAGGASPAAGTVSACPVPAAAVVPAPVGLPLAGAGVGVNVGSAVAGPSPQLTLVTTASPDAQPAATAASAAATASLAHLTGYLFDTVFPFLVGYFHSAFHSASAGAGSVTPVAEALFQRVLKVRSPCYLPTPTIWRGQSAGWAVVRTNT